MSTLLCKAIPLMLMFMASCNSAGGAATSAVHAQAAISAPGDLLFAVFAEIKTHQDINSYVSSLKSVAPQQRFNALMAATTDASVQVDGLNFQSIKRRLLEQKARLTTGAGRAKAAAATDYSGISAQQFKDALKTVHDVVMAGSLDRLGRLGLVDGTCAQSAAAQHGCDTAGKVLDAAGKVIDDSSGEDSSSASVAGAAELVDGGGLYLGAFSWVSKAAKTLSHSVTGSNAKTFTTTLSGAAQICSAVASAVHDAQNCDAATAAANDAEGNAVTGAQEWPTEVQTNNCTGTAVCINNDGSGNYFGS